MKHASSHALDRIAPLLRKLRAREALKEKTRGVFYRGGRAFLHFHEDGEATFADVRLEEDFNRFPATTGADWAALLKRVDSALKRQIKSAVKARP